MTRRKPLLRMVAMRRQPLTARRIWSWRIVRKAAAAPTTTPRPMPNQSQSRSRSRRRRPQTRGAAGRKGAMSRSRNRSPPRRRTLQYVWS